MGHWTGKSTFVGEVKDILQNLVDYSWQSIKDSVKGRITTPLKRRGKDKWNSTESDDMFIEQWEKSSAYNFFFSF